MTLLSSLPEDAYRYTCPNMQCGSAGGHVRHIIEFYQCLLAGQADGRVDYDARARDLKIETCPIAAIHALRDLSLRFPHYEKAVADTRPLRVRESASTWLDSTHGRERQALSSHTVHHMALIAVLLRSQGVSIPSEFGVAPSTLAYRKGLAAASETHARVHA